MSGLAYSNVVDVVSSGVRAVAEIGKLPTILLQPNILNNPLELFNEVNANTYKELLGSGSEGANWLQIYFGVTTKTGQKAETAVIYNYCKEGQGAALVGTSATNKIFGKTGNLKFVKNEVENEIELDLTDATTYLAVANALEEAINDTNIRVYYSPYTKGFIIQSKTLDDVEFSLIENGENLAELLGFKNAKFINMIEEATLSDALENLRVRRGYYYNIVPNFTLTKDEEKELGAFVNESNDDYFSIFESDDEALKTLEDATLELEGYDGLAITYKQNPNQTALISGLISAMDRNQAGGNFDIAFNDAMIYPNRITKQKEYDILLKNKVNFNGQFALMGRTETVTQNAVCFGPKTDSINVYTNNSFIKFSLQNALFNMFKSQPLVAMRGEGGKTLALGTMTPIFQNAVNANIITVQNELTQSEKDVIRTAFPKSSVTAIEQLEKNGFFIEIDRIDLATRTMFINTAYVANKPLGRIMIANRILGA